MKSLFQIRRGPARGSSLLMSLVLLVVLTLLTISAIRMSNSNLRIVGNMQIKKEANAAAQVAIDTVMGSSNIFYAPVAQTINVDINNDGTNDYAVAVAAPTCLRSVSVGGYSYSNAGIAPRVFYWDIQATVTDLRTGAAAVIHQGVKVNLAASATC